jgi:hypothetical protein
MKGLILKDLMNLKKQMRIYAVFMLFYAFFALYGKNASFMVGIIIIFCVMLPVAAFSYDERVKWDRYALSMPVSRLDIVLSKYLLTLMFVLAGLVLVTVWNTATGSGFGQSLAAALGVSAVGILYAAVILPIFLI